MIRTILVYTDDIWNIALVSQYIKSYTLCLEINVHDYFTLHSATVVWGYYDVVYFFVKP